MKAWLPAVWKGCCGLRGGTHTCQRKEAVTEGEDRGLRNEGVAKGHSFFSIVVFYLTTCVKTKSQRESLDCQS